MQPTQNKNIIIIGMLAVLIIIVCYIAFFKKGNDEIKNDYVVTPTGQTQTNQNPNGSDYQPNQVSAQSITWIKSSKFGLYYPSSFTASEFVYLTPAQEEQGASESLGVPEFSATNGNAVISWGGHQSGCGPTQYGAFTKGVSVIACVKGMTARIGVENVRNKVTQSELNIFADFVQKNQ
jgi:hypothetical protein